MPSPEDDIVETDAERKARHALNKPLIAELERMREVAKKPKGIEVEAYERPGEPEPVNWDTVKMEVQHHPPIDASTEDVIEVVLNDEPPATSASDEIWRAWVDENEAKSIDPLSVLDPEPVSAHTRWVTKDSGVRAEYDSGMVRDTDQGKARFDLLVPLGVPYEAQLLTRFAELMTRGAVKYGDRNWEKANSQQELDRFKSSAFRHFMQWLTGETDEDHAAAVLFNMDAAETTQYKMEANTTHDGSSQGNTREGNEDGGEIHRASEESCTYEEGDACTCP